MTFVYVAANGVNCQSETTNCKIVAKRAKTALTTGSRVVVPASYQV